jgi:hypothetical protein
MLYDQIQRKGKSIESCELFHNNLCYECIKKEMNECYHCRQRCFKFGYIIERLTNPYCR